jgi:hypothetical protein
MQEMFEMFKEFKGCMKGKSGGGGKSDWGKGGKGDWGKGFKGDWGKSYDKGGYGMDKGYDKGYGKGYDKGGYDKGYGKGGYGKGGSFSVPKPVSFGAPASSGKGPEVYWLALPGGSLMMEGFPATAPAVVYDKNVEIFSSHNDLISQCVGDSSRDVQIEDDADWKTYPEIGEALTAAGCSDEYGYAVAKCPSQGKWAVGIASGWKMRERAANVAMAMALAAGTPRAESLTVQFPVFGAMIDSETGGGGGGPVQVVVPAKPMDALSAPTPGAGFGGMQHSNPSLPPVLLVDLDPSAKLVLEGLPSTGVVVSYGGSSYKNFFANAHNILQDIIGDTSRVTFHDDPDWTNFPEVGPAIRAAGGEENCYSVAVCESMGVWGAGLAAGKKPRESAAKMAMALALSNAPNFSGAVASYPEFGKICSAIGLVEGFGGGGFSPY